MFELFGPDMPLAAKFFIAFAVVLALIGLTAWLVRRFGANRLGGGTRGRQPRLAVIDAATVDGRRRLVLIRRDNIEHLLMIGGPTDVVVEQNIVRATSNRDVARESTPRPAPTVEGTWPLQPANEPAPIASPRAYRPPATEEPWLAPEPGARPRPADSLTGLAAELSTRLTPPDVASPVVRSEAPPRANVAPVAPPPAAPEPAATAQNDHNLAEMAQQLEAALRRAPPPESRPPVTDPLAKPTPARDFKPRVEPKFEPKFEPKTKVEVPAEPKLEPATAPGKPAFDNLEEEMASLLGRPPGKT
jgi:flagellar protein FliO/FliZ